MKTHLPICFWPNPDSIAELPIHAPLRPGEHISIVVVELEGQRSVGWGKWWAKNADSGNSLGGITDAGIPHQAPESHQTIIWAILHEQNLFWGKLMNQ